MLTESLLLSVFGGAAGLLLAQQESRRWSRGPDHLSPFKLSRIDASVLGFTFLSVLLTVIVAGLVPALRHRESISTKA